MSYKTYKVTLSKHSDNALNGVKNARKSASANLDLIYTANASDMSAFYTYAVKLGFDRQRYAIIERQLGHSDITLNEAMSLYYVASVSIDAID